MHQRRRFRWIVSPERDRELVSPPMNDLAHCLCVCVMYLYMSIASRSPWSSSSPSDPQSTVAVVYLWFRERFHMTQDDVSHRGVFLSVGFVLKLMFTDLDSWIFTLSDSPSYLMPSISTLLFCFHQCLMA